MSVNCQSSAKVQKPKRRMAPHGDPQKWLQEHTHYDGRACLIWPYGTNDKGQGYIIWAGKKRLASTAMCMLVHGPRPSSKHRVYHISSDCHPACVHPKHVNWMTHSDGHMVRPLDVRQRPSKSRSLSPDQVRYIRESSLRNCELARELGTANATISHIRLGKTYKDIK